MSKANNVVFIILQVVAWLIFVGLCIETGGFVVNFIFSIYNPEVLDHLYQKLDITELYGGKKVVFFSVYSFILAISFLKAGLFYIVIRLMLKLDLMKPFNSFVVRQVALLSYFTLSIGVLSAFAKEFINRLMLHGFTSDSLQQQWNDAEAFILMGAVIYIIAVIFKRGVEIQSENDLTV